jgi:transposase-like protein
MEAKTNGRVQRSAAEWQQILSRFTESGRSRAAFCRAEGIAPATLHLWQRKLGAKKAAQKAARDFVEVTRVAEPGLGGWQVEIELPDGRIARLRC